MEQDESVFIYSRCVIADWVDGIARTGWDPAGCPRHVDDRKSDLKKFLVDDSFRQEYPIFPTAMLDTQALLLAGP